MSKALRSMEPYERDLAISRRIAGNARGLGYWAAMDARGLRPTKTKKVEQEVEE